MIMEKIFRKVIKLYLSISLRKKFTRNTVYQTCHLCGEKSFSVLANKERYSIPLRTVLCNSCGLIFFDPMPTSYLLKIIYENYYQRFHRNAIYPSESVIQREKKRAQKCINLIGKYSFPETLRVLDIGCSAGYILSEIKNTFNDKDVLLTGIEPDKNYVSFIKNTHPEIDVYCGMLENYSSIKKYNLVLLMHGLEHILNPTRALEIIKTLLSPSGILYLETPNIFRTTNKLSDFFLFSKLYTFTPISLQYFLEKNGFEMIECNDRDDKHICALFKYSPKTSKRLNFSDLKQNKNNLRQFLNMKKKE